MKIKTKTRPAEMYKITITDLSLQQTLIELTPAELINFINITQLSSMLNKDPRTSRKVALNGQLASLVQ